ncbi:MAG: tRNA (N(6)-L-threonylcarbamoyladenosine(37)-C(2))-methylthiotransferase MtaB [Deltaproteobacteria bacterium]|nr:tRNA (N(6)-L-threonylcarbamoyladenosine(37)-C(2))-methylthiotransferase MtaB [Deltaproteobacteria bacterium]
MADIKKGIHSSFKIITLGCKVNHCDSAYMENSFIDAGLKNVSDDAVADLTIINTCIVTQRASYQSRQAIRKAIRENPSGRIAAVGCYGQVFPEELSGIKGLDLIVGNSDKPRLSSILNFSDDTERPLIIAKDFGKDTTFDALPMKNFMNRARAFLKIQDGCESFCSYCIVPYARGPLRSLEPVKVLRALENFSNEGYREVVLTGVHLGKYGVGLGKRIDIKGLLRMIGKEHFPVRIRLSSLEPNEITQELIEMVASEDWLCRHFHIPLQSGDDNILRRMNRRYSSRQFAKLIMKIRELLPRAAIGADIMAGFPGEDTGAYRNSLRLLEDLPVSYLHIFPFSPRRGTPAADFPDRVNEKIVKERAGELRKLGRLKREIFNNSCIGEDFPVIMEGWFSNNMDLVRGLSDNYLKVVFPASRLIRDSIIRVRVEGVDEEMVFGKISQPAMLRGL